MQGKKIDNDKRLKRIVIALMIAVYLCRIIAGAIIREYKEENPTLATITGSIEQFFVSTSDADYLDNSNNVITLYLVPHGQNMGGIMIPFILHDETVIDDGMYETLEDEVGNKTTYMKYLQDVTIIYNLDALDTAQHQFRGYEAVYIEPFWGDGDLIENQDFPFVIKDERLFKARIFREKIIAKIVDIVRLEDREGYLIYVHAYEKYKERPGSGAEYEQEKGFRCYYIDEDTVLDDEVKAIFDMGWRARGKEIVIEAPKIYPFEQMDIPAALSIEFSARGNSI